MSPRPPRKPSESSAEPPAPKPKPAKPPAAAESAYAAGGESTHAAAPADEPYGEPAGRDLGGGGSYTDPCSEDPCGDLLEFTEFAAPEECIEPRPPLRYKPIPDPPIFGIVKENILICAELVYIGHFEAAFEAVDTLCAGYRKGTFALDCGVASRVDRYMVRRFRHVPDDDRREFMTHVRSTVEPLAEELYGTLMELYRASAIAQICDGADAGATPAPMAAARYAIENAQITLSRLGGGIATSIMRRCGNQLTECFMILNSPDLPRCIGGGCEGGGMTAMIDRLGQLRDDGGPAPEPAYRSAKQAVAARHAILELAELDDLDELLVSELDALAAQLALSVAVSGRELQAKERISDKRAQEGAELLRLARRSARSASPFRA